MVQGLLLGVFLVARSSKKKPSFLMGCFLLTWGASFIIHVLANRGFTRENPSLFYLPIRFYFLSFPLLYLYVKRLMGELSFKKEYRHLIVGLIEFVFFSALAIFLPKELKVEWFQDPAKSIYFQSYYLTANLFVIYYLLKIFRLLKENEERICAYYSAVEQRLFSGIQPILKGFLYLLVQSSLFLIALMIFSTKIEFRFYIYLILSFTDLVLTYWLAIFATKQYFIQTEEKVLMVTKEINQEIQKRYDDGFDELFNDIIEAIAETKCFKQKEFTIVDLSSIVDIHYGKLSRIIKYKTNSNFSTFINKHRIEEAKRVMENKARMKGITLEVLASEVGFKAESTFYNSFKKFEGTTPAKYSKKLS